MIDKFKNEYSFLSNFYKCSIRYDNKFWGTAEHLYQALKTIDSYQREQIRSVSAPGEARKIGQNVILRPGWEFKRYDIMRYCVRLKFEQNRILRKRLLFTGEKILVEGNYWHDNIWGDCICSKCKDIEGQNCLGEILMLVRSKITTDF